MDQLTHTVRRSNWINIIRQCQDRPAGTTAKQWLAENDISEKSYYYWLRKIRREVCEQEGLQEDTNPSALSFVETSKKLIVLSPSKGFFSNKSVIRSVKIFHQWICKIKRDRKSVV